MRNLVINGFRPKVITEFVNQPKTFKLLYEETGEGFIFNKSTKDGILLSGPLWCGFKPNYFQKAYFEDGMLWFETVKWFYDRYISILGGYPDESIELNVKNQWVNDFNALLREWDNE